MKQALECHGFPQRVALGNGWFSQLRSRLFRLTTGEDAIPLEARSPHLLRDIGLAEDVRANHLLRDCNFFRR